MSGHETKACRRELQRLLIDAAHYSNDARIAGRRDLRDNRFTTLRARLVGAKTCIDGALKIVAALCEQKGGSDG